MMIEEKRNVTAPCGLYCVACTIYRASKRGDSETLTQIKEQFRNLFALEEGQQPPGMPPPAKGSRFSQVQREIQAEAGMYCEGCLSDVVAPQCRICGFRDCTKEKGITTCAECPDMPCQWVIDFNNDGMPHHGEVLINLERQKEIGIDAWLAEQEERWRCVKCGSPLSWYDVNCPDCHTALRQTFNPLALSD